MAVSTHLAHACYERQPTNICEQHQNGPMAKRQNEPTQWKLPWRNWNVWWLLFAEVDQLSLIASLGCHLALCHRRSELCKPLTDISSFCQHQILSQHFYWHRTDDVKLLLTVDCCSCSCHREGSRTRNRKQMRNKTGRSHDSY